MDILFAPHNAYHTRTFAAAAAFLKSSFIFVDVEKRHREGSAKMISELQLPSVEYSPGIIRKLRPRLIVVMNDWGGWPADLIRLGRKMGIPTAGHVEGVQDFIDSHISHTGRGRMRLPYQHNEFPLLIGDYDRKFIKNKNAIVVGCPRFDTLLETPTSFPEVPKVCINSNFTYKLYTDIQRDWLRDAISASEQSGYDYHITKHHSDFGVPDEMSVYQGSMYESIKYASVFVSRFSTGILEAMCLGKPAVYYNPHGEMQDTFQDPRGAFPIARDRDTLQTAIRDAIEDPDSTLTAREEFLEYHIGNLDGKSSQRFAAAADKLVRIGRERSIEYQGPDIFTRARYYFGPIRGLINRIKKS
jgi:hypothetical protein